MPTVATEGAKVLVLFGSESQLPRMEAAFAILEEFEVPYGAAIVSAHRDPERLARVVREAEAEGVQVFICGADLAAHLAGMTAAHTTRPVIGVPLGGGPLGGQDALLATVQMPSGVPVATVGIDRADNAALLAVAILALADEGLARRLHHHRLALREAVRERDVALQARLAGRDARA
jgi:phosphoribosylaminoimidazole carboxylase PurE protein